MHQLAQATGKAVAYLAQRIGVRELAEQHANELRPTGEPARMTFPLVFLDDAGKCRSRDLFQDLTEQTGGLYHRDALLAVVVNRTLRYPILQRTRRVVKTPSSES
jgi:hypothetical protein